MVHSPDSAEAETDCIMYATTHGFLGHTRSHGAYVHVLYHIFEMASWSTNLPGEGCSWLSL